MKIRNRNFNLFNFASGLTLIVMAMAISTQFASGQPQPLSLEQLKSVTGGGECENCQTDESTCKEADTVDCLGSAQTPGKFNKRAWTGQNTAKVLTGLDTGIVDYEANTPEKCSERWTNCDKDANGDCINCDTTSTTGTVNSNCHKADPTECPAS